MHILLARGGLNVMTLLGTFPSGIAQGMIWGIMALGVYITFRMLDIADLTVDGSFTTGGAVAVVLITSGVNCWLALAAATLAGLIAGLVTGILHTRLGIPAILSGILTQFALYSINLAIMGFSANRAVSVDRYALSISSRYINAALITGALIAVALVSVLYWYFGTEHGSAMRATGNNPDMSKALGININSMKVIGLAISNALVAFSGGLMAQYQGFADINMGRGCIVIGLAAVIIGEAVFAFFHNFAAKLLAVTLGSVIYYFVYNVVIWLGIDADLLKLLSAIVVAIFLATPYLRSKYMPKKAAKKITDGEGA